MQPLLIAAAFVTGALVPWSPASSPSSCIDTGEKIMDTGTGARVRIGTREQLLYTLTEVAEIEHNLMCCYLYAGSSTSSTSSAPRAPTSRTGRGSDAGEATSACRTRATGRCRAGRTTTPVNERGEGVRGRCRRVVAERDGLRATALDQAGDARGRAERLAGGAGLVDRREVPPPDRQRRPDRGRDRSRRLAHEPVDLLVHEHDRFVDATVSRERQGPAVRRTCRRSSRRSSAERTTTLHGIIDGGHRP